MLIRLVFGNVSCAPASSRPSVLGRFPYRGLGKSQSYSLVSLVLVKVRHSTKNYSNLQSALKVDARKP